VAIVAINHQPAVLRGSNSMDEIKQTVDLISKYLKEDWYGETKDYLLTTNLRTATYETHICAFNIEQAINDFYINGLITFDVAEELKETIAEELMENNTEELEIGQEFYCTDMHDIEYIVSLVGKNKNKIAGIEKGKA
jgi:hypothetical protein